MGYTENSIDFKFNPKKKIVLNGAVEKVEIH